MTRDRYGRLVAEVFLAETDQSFEEELLKAGLAKVFWRYVDDCPNAEPFKLAEEMAKDGKVGLWREGVVLAEWVSAAKSRPRKAW